MSLVIDVRDLIENPGSSRTLRMNEPVPGLGTELAEVPEDRRVQASLLLESVVEGVLVTGPISGAMVLTCARCVKPFESDLRVEVQKLFAREAGPGDDEYPLGDGSMDLEPMIRDAILLTMPFAPLCRPDCLGLCDRCGGDRNLGECLCEPEFDSRWEPLAGIDLERVERGSSDRTG